MNKYSGKRKIENNGKDMTVAKHKGQDYN